MNRNIQSLIHIATKNSRRVVGLMSGTSLDGLDIALCSITGHGMSTKVEIEAFETISYDNEFKAQVKGIFSKQIVNLEMVCLMNAYIGTLHAQMINDTLKKWNIANNEIDIIASHGQTIYHAPKILHEQNNFDNATLQIGDGDHIAVKTGIITLSDFRQKHIAAGGEGAPLAVYGDYLIFSSAQENRIMLNIGGVANFTYLPKSLDASKVFSTDVGPGNTIMDAYVQQFFTGLYFDKDAAIAKQGTINQSLLEALKMDAYFTKPLPKTTGPELFNLAYLQAAQTKTNTQHLSHYDCMATLNKFTADVIVTALNETMHQEDFVVYSSGGGMHNPLLMQHLKQQLPNVSFKNTNELFINPDAKEAVLFAVLANECIVGGNTVLGNGISNVTMGKISFPW
ncbi:MAG: anhydro-N-acetylmuramic acid kinase [Chitinophagaceae bacterium]